MSNPRFNELLEEMRKLHDAKNHDYAPGDDPLFNLRMSASFDVEPWIGTLVRMSDKMARLWSYAKKQGYEVQDEGVKDTLMDLAIYSLLCSILYEERSNGNRR